MPRRRKINALKQQLARPPAELSLSARLLLWAFRSDTRSVLVIGILFAVGMTLQYLLPADLNNVQGVAVAVLVLLIFGTFLGVIVVTEDNKKYSSSGAWIRALCGAGALAAIAVLLSAPLSVIALAALVGVVLGYSGIYWARYI